MKIKRYFAPDIRQAIRMVREEQGPDAVILSNRKVDGGVEIVAARDFDEDTVRGQAREGGAGPQSGPAAVGSTMGADRPAARPGTPPSAEGAEAKRRAEGAFLEVLGRVGAAEAAEAGREDTLKPALQAARRAGLVPAQTRPAAPPNPGLLEDRPAATPAPRPKAPPKTPPTPARVERPVAREPGRAGESHGLGDLYREIRQLRHLVDHHLAETGWQIAANRAPTRLDLLRRLSGMGFSRRLSLALAERAGEVEDFDGAWDFLRGLLALQIPLAQENLLDEGGVVALVGPTGVGKTTTIAKLAARFRMEHGPRQVALITLDNYRIGAEEQLATYGRILDVPVRTASNLDELCHLLASFHDRRLVLIDTAGMGQRDRRLAEQAEILAGSELPIRSYLVLSAASQYRVMAEAIERFGACAPAACVLTKLDEAVQLGTALSAVIEQRLPVTYLCDGQQVPEDLHLAGAQLLLDRCFAEHASQEDDEAGPYTYREWVAHASF